MVKIKRSYPAPKSLAEESQKVNGSYAKGDVINRLQTDFNNKCYICELDNLQDPQVEHLLPHKNGKFPERKFDWENLFWCCSHCNSVKNQNKYDEGIIDCCKEDPEELLGFSLMNENVFVLPFDSENEKAALTSELVMEVFNLQNTGMREYKSDMRLRELQKEMNKLYDAVEEVTENPDSSFAKRKVRALLRRESRFAAFKRSYIKENGKKDSILKDYLT